MIFHELCVVAVNLLWRASWQSAILIGGILLIRRLLGERLSPAWRCTLWMLVAVRLVMPVMPAAPWSLFNLISPAAADSSPVVAEVTIHISPTSDLQPTANQSSHRSDRAQYLALLWLAGALALAGGAAWTNLNFSRRVRRSARPASGHIFARWQSLGRQMGLRKIPPIVCTSAVSSPALFGLWRGRLLLPRDFVEDLGENETRLVLMHELTHIRRRDLPMGWLMAGLRMIHWFNPLAWIALACWRADAEAACDRAVLDAVDARGRIDYGLTLLKLATCPHLPAPRSALGIIDGERQLRRRIGAIVRTDRPWRFGAAALIAILAFFGLTDARSRARAAAAPTTQPGRTVVVSARFVTIDPARLADFGITDARRGNVTLTDLSADALLKAAGADSVISSPRIMLNDGQEGKISVGTSTNYVADLIPTIHPDGQVSYAAKVDTAWDGMDWSVLPVIGNGNELALDMHIKFTKLKELTKVPWHKNPNLLVQSPLIETRGIDMKIAVADGQSAILSGLDDDKKTTIIVITPKIVPAGSR